MKNPSAVLMYDSSVRSFANSVRCRASRSLIAVSNLSGIDDPRILAETLPLQRAKLNRPGEKAVRRREDARADVMRMVPGTFFTLRKMLFDRIVDFSRAYLISCDTDPNRQTGSRIRKGFQIDPHMLPIGKL